MSFSRMRSWVVATTVVVALGATSVASATAPSVTVRSVTAADDSLTIAISSVGDAGDSHGNLNYWTSPVNASGAFYWFNKDVSVTDFHLAEGTFASASSARDTGEGYGVYEELAEPYVSTQEGVYSVAAAGLDGLAVVSGTVTPAFGIDKTAPIVTTDREPFYNGAPVVTVEATDALSGVENVLFTVDMATNVCWEPDPAQPSVFSTGFPFVGAGTHTISWIAFDNAGNPRTGSTSFLIDNTLPVTTSNVASRYNGSARIVLTPGDTGGSGVAHTYYSLDGSAAVDATMLVVPAPRSGIATHSLEFWSVDGAGNVEESHVATFSVRSRHYITPSRSNAYGRITPSTRQTVYYGSSKTFYMKPKAGYHVAKVVVDGRSKGARTSYRFTNVKASHTIRVYFAKN